jgi:hypothetical protein
LATCSQLSAYPWHPTDERFKLIQPDNRESINVFR